ncbi:glycosyltransferase family 2 protein [Limnoglobus roseus]|uniref:GT2 family glycosyltransferase n=1 Tax=Limnoglobus roseus TaxID=2598579 RepID=A0A5C1AHN0_9BACT|nr:glycosyltransferase family 2 protein [Limnoglobus roseus]QEL18145.1 GT2 family glycosyltransferase [Limnoglobus roseus]
MALAFPPADETTDPALRTRPTQAAPSEVAVPRLSVVVVNFCQWQNTARLTRQLRHSDAVRAGEANVVIVDNGSPAEQVMKNLRGLRGVKVELNSANLGFAAAVNRGVRVGPSEWVLLLNPDVTVEDGFLDEVLVAVDAAVKHDSATGVIGFRLLNADGTDQASAGHFPTFASTLKGLFLPRSRRKCHHQSSQDRRQVQWVTGGCLLVRRDCFQELGGLDERFFLYYEDVDFCRRVQQFGRTVWYDPRVAVTHHWPLHKRTVPAPLRFITRHALLTFAGRHWKPWQRAALRRLVHAEARAREGVARWRGDSVAAACYRELRLQTSRKKAHPADVSFVAQFLRPIAAAQDTPSEP